MISPEHAIWFLGQRGIKESTLEAFGVWSDGDTVVFPYLTGEKRRWGLDKEGSERGFSFTKGAKPSLFGPDLASTLRGRPVFICEGETDTMRLWQEFNEHGAHPAVLGVSGTNGWPEDGAAALAGVEAVYVLPDNDNGYQASQATDMLVARMASDLGYARVHRLALPADVKDVCQFFQGYDLDALREVVAAPPPPPKFTYQAVDLTATPPPIRWLVEDTIALGDITLMGGEPGVGKSWLSMGLAVAVAEGLPDWVGLPILEPGRVLYVDEENPLDVAYNRLRRLGLTERGAANVRFLHRQGVRLDRKPKDLLMEAQAWQPNLIVLDSLSRLHSQDESSNGAMAALFNDGINPLARVSGAALLLLHHVGKGDSKSSFQRIRGAGDITGSIDAGIDVREVAHGGYINLVYFKSRRRPDGDTTMARITDLEGGRVEVRPTMPGATGANF